MPELSPRKIIGPFVKWTRENFLQVEQRSRKPMRCIRPYISELTKTDCICQEKKGGSGLAINQDSIDASIQGLEDDIKNRGGKLITATRDHTDCTRTNRTKITRKWKWKEKLFYEHFDKQVKSHTKKLGHG